MKNKNVFLSKSAVLLVLIVQVFSSCTFAGPMGVKGSGKAISEERQISSFRGLDVSGGFEVILTQGQKQSLVLEADDNLMREIITEVRGGELNIYVRGSVSPVTKMKAYLTFVQLEDIDISGAVKLFSEQKLSFDRLSIDGSGASKIDFSADMQSLKGDFSGASTITLSGNLNDLSIECSGASKLYLSDLLASTAKLELSGASYAEVNVSEKLRVDASGASYVRYKGDPKDVSFDNSGASKVRKM